MLLSLLYIFWIITISVPVSAEKSNGYTSYDLSKGVIPKEAVRFLQQSADYEEWGCDTPEGYQNRLGSIFSPITPAYVLRLMLMQKSSQGPSLSGVRFHGMKEGEFLVSTFLLQGLDRVWVWGRSETDEYRYVVMMGVDDWARYYDFSYRDKDEDIYPRQLFRCERIDHLVNP